MIYKKSKSSMFAIVSTAFLSSLTPMTVTAQETNDTSLMLEEIVVTARKRSESLQETPISISAFTSADLEARNLDSVNQIAEATPNLVFNNVSAQSGNSANSTIYIRGVGQNDHTLNVDPGVGLYVDGVYVSRSTGSLVDLLEVERIEVLRGPQGTLFGRNTIGGAVSITSKKPDDDFSAKLGITAGRFDRIEGYGSINLPLSDTLKNRTSFKVKQRDGYYTRIQDGADIGDDDTWSARTVFNWQPTENLEVDFSVDATHERRGAMPTTLLAVPDPTAELAGLHNAVFAPMLDPSVAFPFGPMGPPSSCLLPGTANPVCYNNQWITNDPYSTHAGSPSKSELDLWGVSATVTWDINDNMTLKSITAHRDVSSDASMDFDNSPIVLFDALSQPLDNTAGSQELQLLGTSFDEKLDWIAGVYYLYESGQSVADIDAAFAVITSGGNTTTESQAVFTQGTWHFTKALSLTLGLRYTNDERVYTPDTQIVENKSGPMGPPNGLRLLPKSPFEQSAEDVTPLVNLSYKWSEDLMTYVSYSEGFKAGGFTQRVATPNPAAPSFEPEYAEVYEVGMKWTGLDNRLRLNMSVFWNDYTDMHVTGKKEGVLGAATINAGEAEIKGLEAELSYLPTEEWMIQAGVGYIDAEYTKLEPSVDFVKLSDALPTVPEWSLNASTSYRFELPGGHVLTPRLDWSYVSEVSMFAQLNPITQDSYNLWNASIAFDSADEKWRATISGKNLSDEEYLMTGLSSASYNLGTYAMPRTWAVSLERRFD